MPQLGETVTEGTITKWLKAVGEPVARDEPLFEVSTDKVDSEVPSPAAGVLAEILVPEGETVDVGTVLAVVSDGAGSAPGADGSAAAPAAGGRRRPGTGRRPRAGPRPRHRHPRPPPPLRARAHRRRPRPPSRRAPAGRARRRRTRRAGDGTGSRQTGSSRRSCASCSTRTASTRPR